MLVLLTMLTIPCLAGHLVLCRMLVLLTKLIIRAFAVLSLIAYPLLLAFVSLAASHFYILGQSGNYVRVYSY